MRTLGKVLFCGDLIMAVVGDDKMIQQSYIAAVLSGPPGVGKTQWCLHMSASVVATGEGEGGTSPAVIYIDTECAARPER